jgi:ABC-type Zn uptake system ZnuABC Zn-binding protein ZnuA
MKKTVYLIACLLVLILCSRITQAEDGTNIVCTNSVLADFTNNILPKNFTIDYIMPAGACPVHFDTSPSDVSKIVTSDIIISLGLEPWLPKLIENSGKTDYIEIKCIGLGEWSLPENAVHYIEKISHELSVIIPGFYDTILENAVNFIDEINSTSEELKKMIVRLGYQNRKIICINWYVELLEFLELNVIESYNSPESLSTQDEIDIANAAINNEVCIIIDNLQSGTSFGERIASESGASHVVFTNFPDAINGTNSYVDMINYNIAELIKGITIYDYKQGEIAELESSFSNVEFQRNVLILIVAIAVILTLVIFILYKRK